MNVTISTERLAEILAYSYVVNHRYTYEQHEGTISTIKAIVDNNATYKEIARLADRLIKEKPTEKYWL